MLSMMQLYELYALECTKYQQLCSVLMFFVQKIVESGICSEVLLTSATEPFLIFKELNNDVGKEIPKSGNLINWSKQGVLLLNATLTVRANQAGSHQNKGWEQFTDAVIHKINDQKKHVVFILWGNYAISKGKFIDQSKHLVLTSVHPSPLSASRGFFGNRHFSRANEFLTKNNLDPVSW